MLIQTSADPFVLPGIEGGHPPLSGLHPDENASIFRIRELDAYGSLYREKDYAVIGELARRLESIDERLKYSRSARDLIELAGRYPDKVTELKEQRPVLTTLSDGLESVESALDAERRQLMHANEQRLAAYMTAAAKWQVAWPEISRCLDGKPLSKAHQEMIRRAADLLPVTVPGGLA